MSTDVRSSEIAGFDARLGHTEVTVTTSGLAVIGFGAGSIDYFPPLGDVDPNHIPGNKGAPWSADKDDRLRALLEAEGIESHPGGNILNWLAYFAVASRRNTAFVGLLSKESLPATLSSPILDALA